MPLRDLFCALEVTEKPSNAALHQALASARGYGATASIFVAGPKAAVPYSPFSAGMVGDIVKSENEKVRARAEAMAADAKADLAKSGAAGNVELSLDPFQEILRTAKDYALSHDLTVMDRPGGVIDRSEVLFEEILFSACRPVLLPAPERKPVEKIGKIVLAWDGSPYAARALDYALAYFAGLKEAEVVVVKGEKDLSDMVPAAKIAAHIERHGTKAKVVEVKCDSEGVSSTIDKHGEKAGADLVVMGAFGRSRLREFVLGGVTRDLTRFSKRPLLLSH
jgi:nucleotide-binding universal stress UspA family protein